LARSYREVGVKYLVNGCAVRPLRAAQSVEIQDAAKEVEASISDKCLLKLTYFDASTLIFY
jgi:hypothetical protein